MSVDYSKIRLRKIMGPIVLSDDVAERWGIDQEEWDRRQNRVFRQRCGEQVFWRKRRFRSLGGKR